MSEVPKGRVVGPQQCNRQAKCLLTLVSAAVDRSPVRVVLALIGVDAVGEVVRAAIVVRHKERGRVHPEAVDTDFVPVATWGLAKNAEGVAALVFDVIFAVVADDSIGITRSLTTLIDVVAEAQGTGQVSIVKVERQGGAHQGKGGSELDHEHG